MANQFGVTPVGFMVKQQAQIQAEINASLQSVFGSNINLSANSIFGLLSGIFSEREALIWQVGEAIYDSQYPSGAEGTSVDNILALNNLKRLTAQPTVTNGTALVQSNGITLYGLVLYGTPGTIIPVGSLIQTTDSPPLSFALNASVTIQAAVNAAQTIFFSNVPNTGAFSISIEDANGQTLTTESIPYTATYNESFLALSSTPAASSGFKLQLSSCGNLLTTATISTNAAYPTASAIQSAIRALSGYSGVTVALVSTGLFSITWGSIAHPLLSVTANTTTVTITPTDTVQAAFSNLKDTAAATTTGALSNGSTSVTVASASGIYPGQSVTDSTTGGNIQAGTVVTAVNYQTKVVTLSLAAAANASADSLTFQNFYPYSDVVVTGSFSAGFLFSFGAGSVVGSNPSSGSQPQAIILDVTNTLQNGSSVTNMDIVNSTVGAPAQGVGAATCTANGPNFVPAGGLSVIGSPVSGWTSVTNQLDCILGSNLETDTQALVRRSKSLQAQANGPLQSIIEKVSQIQGVTACIGFENTTQAALQVLTFGGSPSTGGFTIVVNGTPTSSITSFTAAAIQSAIRGVSGYSNVVVTGNASSGFTIDFNGSNGGQPQSLMTVGTNTTGISITIAFGRPGKSFEIVVNGGDDNTIANTILAAKPAGIQSYGSTTVVAFDIYGNSYNISFSRPTEVAIYIVVELTTDLTTSATPKFSPSSIPTIQQDLADIGNSFGIGGLVIGMGTNGLIGAFNSIPGITSYNLYFGTSPGPSTSTNIQMLPEQVPLFELFNIAVSYV